MEKDPRSAEDILMDLLKSDPRYEMEAYRFTFHALDYTVRSIGEKCHVTGRELLFGFRDLAIETFGPLAHMVLNTWGLFRSEDIGNLVFNLVENQLMSKNENDSIEDFRNGFDFEEAFGEIPVEVKIH